MKTIPHSSKLNDQQKYLLGRIPAQHQLNGYQKREEPKEVKDARKVIERWEKQESLLDCQARKRNEALIRKAKEAVYFYAPDKALAIV